MQPCVAACVDLQRWSYTALPHLLRLETRCQLRERPLTHSAEHITTELHPADGGEATKPTETILRQEIATGEEQLERKTTGLLLSAVSAGLDVGFGPLMVVAVLAASPDRNFKRARSSIRRTYGAIADRARAGGRAAAWPHARRRVSVAVWTETQGLTNALAGEVERMIARGWSVAAGAAHTRYSGTSAIPDPLFFGRFYQRVFAPVLDITTSPMSATALTLGARWRRSDGSLFWVQARSDNLSARQRLEYVADGGRRGTSVLIGVVLP